jgi:hypothetical protein
VGRGGARLPPIDPVVPQAIVDGFILITRKFCCGGRRVRAKFAAAVRFQTAIFGMTVAMGILLRPARVPGGVAR